MHELSLTQELIAAACEAAEREGKGTRVSRIVLECGALSAVLPEAISFCFELCTEGTAAEGAALEIVRVPGMGRCRACGGETRLERPAALCGCGQGDLEWISGEELKIKQVEVVSCA